MLIIKNNDLRDPILNLIYLLGFERKTYSEYFIHKSYDVETTISIMLVPGPVKIQSILSFTKLVAMLTEIANTSHMVNLNVVSHIG